ncbi:hypothetical protein K458DRAFT_287618, partial [Lentithecium fluviatile CBS 122367]
GAFRLTNPPGMKAVLNCTQTGIFHPHSEGDIYINSMKTGHVCKRPDWNLTWKIFDHAADVPSRLSS